jgi:hypothetical protein
MTLFLTPPPWDIEVGHAGGGETLSRREYLDLVFDMPADARRRLLDEVVELSAPTTLALRRWGENFAEMVAERQGAVDALLALHEATLSQRDEERG